MSVFPDRAIVEQAIAWHLRLQDADEHAWAEFADWLSLDPIHNEAYEAVVDGDARMLPVLEQASFPETERALPTPQSSNDDDYRYAEGDDGAARNPWRWGALAASLAVAGLVGVQLLSNRDATYPVETSVGETRTLALADGSEIQLNGKTRLILDKNDDRSVEIAHGEARFVVTHDDADPFIVVAGDQRLVDIGTVFNVVHTDRQLRVAVSEGAVRYEGFAQEVELFAGDALVVSDGKIEKTQLPVATIGSWTGGRLVYDQAPLQQVAEDLFRSTGISLELPSRMRPTIFSGVIQTDGDPDTLRQRLEELIGERIVAEGTRWSIGTR